MTKKCSSCGSCGMPLEKAADFACGDTNSSYCRYCTDENGELLPFATVLEGTAKFYVESQGTNLATAQKMARELLLTMPAWQEK